MGFKLVHGLAFKPVEYKKNNITPKRKYNKRTYMCCVCVQENDKFFAKVRVNNSDVIIPFTEESYSVKGKREVFTTMLNQFGKPIKIIRSKQHADHFPGIDTQYTPFRKDYVYSGYLVDKDDSKEFAATDIQGHFSQFGHLIENVIIN